MDGSAVILLFRMAVSLAVVLGLIVWAARLLNRRGGGLMGRPRVDVPLSVLGRQSLSRHASVSIVRVGEQILVLGVTDAEVSLLAEVDPATLPTLEATSPKAGPLRAAAGSPGGEARLASPQDLPTFAASLANALPMRRAAERQAVAARAFAERLSSASLRLNGRHRG